MTAWFIFVIVVLYVLFEHGLLIAIAELAYCGVHNGGSSCLPQVQPNLRAPSTLRPWHLLIFHHAVCVLAWFSSKQQAENMAIPDQRSCKRPRSKSGPWPMGIWSLGHSAQPSLEKRHKGNQQPQFFFRRMVPKCWWMSQYSEKPMNRGPPEAFSKVEALSVMFCRVQFHFAAFELKWCRRTNRYPECWF